MKNINRILSISVGLFVLLFTSCTEDLPEREPSPTTLAGCAQVFFPNSNATTLELEQTATTVPVTISRENTSGAVTVPITVLRNDSNIFVIPETISFGSGEAEASFNVTFSGASPGINYAFEIIVEGEEYVDAYTIFEGNPSITFNISLSDWADFATGTYEAAFFETSWTQVLQYSVILDSYRFPNLFADGYHFVFKWDGGLGITPVGETDDDGYYIFETGYIHPDYGMVTVHIDSSTDWTYYVESADAFVFDGDWTVSAGSFGWLDDFYYITERF